MFAPQSPVMQLIPPPPPTWQSGETSAGYMHTKTNINKRKIRKRCRKDPNDVVDHAPTTHIHASSNESTSSGRRDARIRGIEVTKSRCLGDTLRLQGFCRTTAPALREYSKRSYIDSWCGATRFHCRDLCRECGMAEECGMMTVECGMAEECGTTEGC